MVILKDVEEGRRQNSLVLVSILKLDQDRGCLDQVGTNVDLEI